MNDIIPLISKRFNVLKMPMVARWQGFHKAGTRRWFRNESSGKLWLAGHIQWCYQTTVPDECVAARLNDPAAINRNYVILLWSLVIKMS